MLRRLKNYRYKVVQYKSDLPKPKRNEVVIVPVDNRIIDFSPYVGEDKLPSWWTSLPKGKGSLRRCQGTYDYVTQGFYIPLWTNITVRPNMNGHHFEVKTDPIDGLNFHVDGFGPETARGCPIEHTKALEQGQYLKLVSPWRFITQKGTSLMSLPMLFEPDPRFSVVPGIVHTDYYHQINIVINVHTDKEFTIPAGTPIQHMIPVKRNNNTRKIIWGNESMYRFVAASGLGEGQLIHQDKSVIYRKLQRRMDSDD